MSYILHVIMVLKEYVKLKKYDVFNTSVTSENQEINNLLQFIINRKV